jgi:uncharacterized membrane protein
MSRRPKGQRDTRSVSPAHALRTVPNWPLLAIGSLGIVLTTYLSWAAFAGGAVRGCAAGGGCDVVLSSRWATLLGLPTASWGLLAYASLAGIAFIRRADRHWFYAWTVAFFGVCYSVYLTTVSLTILGSACPYCLTSLALMAATLGLVVWQRPPEIAQRSWLRLSAGRAALAGLVILVLHGSYIAPRPEPIGPEDPTIRALAEHLSDEGALFYGASWCSHCQEQKRLFGASAGRLPYIECSPGGQGTPQSSSCSAVGIQRYPTWVINGQTYAGEVLSLAQLASMTSYPDAAKLK